MHISTQPCTFGGEAGSTGNIRFVKSRSIGSGFRRRRRRRNRRYIRMRSRGGKESWRGPAPVKNADTAKLGRMLPSSSVRGRKRRRRKSPFSSPPFFQGGLLLLLWRRYRPGEGKERNGGRGGGESAILLNCLGGERPVVKEAFQPLPLSFPSPSHHLSSCRRRRCTMTLSTAGLPPSLYSPHSVVRRRNPKNFSWDLSGGQ